MAEFDSSDLGDLQHLGGGAGDQEELSGASQLPQAGSRPVTGRPGPFTSRPVTAGGQRPVTAGPGALGGGSRPVTSAQDLQGQGGQVPQWMNQEEGGHPIAAPRPKTGYRQGNMEFQVGIYTTTS